MSTSTPFEPPPSFLRRHAAGSLVDDPDALVALASDDNFWVRREAVRNPATPRWVIDLLVRAGADPHLRGRGGDPDVDLAEEDLRRLVECGPWARELVAEHPNTDAEVLRVLAALPSRRLKLAVAAHSRVAPTTIAGLCVDADAEVRAIAVANRAAPVDVVALLHRAGASSDLGTIDHRADLDAPTLDRLANVGPWARFLAARHPDCPRAVIERVAADEDWTIRSGVLDNPRVPHDVVVRVIGGDEADVERVAPLHAARPAPHQLDSLARHESTEVRLAVARNPHTGAAALGRLAADGATEVRRVAARNPRTAPAAVERLVRAGSTPDLMRLAEPDPTMGPDELGKLAEQGDWARQLVVRHPASSPATLARLLCDENPRVREWAGAHPGAPGDVIAEIRRAGGADDYQGIGPCDPTMREEALCRVAALGPWGAWVVSYHPNAPAELARDAAGDSSGPRSEDGARA